MYIFKKGVLILSVRSENWNVEAVNGSPGVFVVVMAMNNQRREQNCWFHLDFF